MAGQTPGPTCQHKKPVNVDDGTLCRASTPAPGSGASGAATGVAGKNRKHRPKKLPAPPVHELSAEEAARLAKDKLPKNVTVTTPVSGNTPKATDKGPSGQQPTNNTPAGAPAGQQGTPKPAEGGDDDDKPTLGLDLSAGANVGAAGDWQGVTGQLTLVGRNIDVHRFMRNGNRFVDLFHEPSLSLSLSLDGVGHTHVAAQAAVSAVNFHLLQKNGDDVLEAALTTGLSYDYDLSGPRPRSVLTGLSFSPGAQVEWHQNKHVSFTLSTSVAVSVDPSNGSYNVKLGEVVVTPGVLIHY